MLRALILTLHDDAARLVSDAHRRIGFVDVLTAGAGRAIGVDAQIGRIDVDGHVLVDVRRNEQRREGRVAAIARIEGGFAHQPMHSALRAQPAVGVIALDLHRHALDAGDFAGGNLADLGVESAAFAPAQIHSQQHLGPVLRLGAAGAGVDRQPGVARIHFAVEHALKLQRLEPALAVIEILLDRKQRGFVILLARQHQQLGRVVQRNVQRLDRIERFEQRRALAPQIATAIGILPDLRRSQLLFHLAQALFLSGIVKDTPSTPSGAAENLRSVAAKFRFRSSFKGFDFDAVHFIASTAGRRALREFHGGEARAAGAIHVQLHSIAHFESRGKTRA